MRGSVVMAIVFENVVRAGVWICWARFIISVFSVMLRGGLFILKKLGLKKFI